jgi:prepilin-type N-terminal cleavage/methylation domain-containing protein
VQQQHLERQHLVIAGRGLCGKEPDMSGHDPKPIARRPHRGGGFSLVELIAVLVITGVLAAVAAPTLGLLGSTRERYACRQIVRDVTYSRERALDTGTRQFIVFAVAGSAYTLLAEDRANPGRANAVILAQPSGMPFVRTLGAPDYPGVAMSTVDFDGGSEVGFDWAGAPLNSGQNPLGATGIITLSGGCQVRVLPGSGLVTCTIP